MNKKNFIKTMATAALTCSVIVTTFAAPCNAHLFDPDYLRIGLETNIELKNGEKLRISDANRDGYINTYDIEYLDNYIMDHCLSCSAATMAIERPEMDINGDKKVSPVDVTILKRYYNEFKYIIRPVDVFPFVYGDDLL